MKYLEVYYLISKSLEIFLLSLYHWLLHDSTEVTEYTLHDSNSDKFVNVCFMAHDWLVLVNGAWKKC